jgi:protein-S-isoprenylcysteine O-methyltransferase Ste14
MQLALPDIGDLLVTIALLFTALIILFDTLARRRENQREQRLLDAIEEEYRAYCRLGRL